MTVDHDPRPMIEWARARLDEAWTTWSLHEDARKARVEEEGGVWRPDVLTPIQAAHAMGTIAQAAAILQPTPEEVLEAYEGVAVEVDEGAASKLQEVHAILDEARRRGPRHPAVSAALKVLEATEGR